MSRATRRRFVCRSHSSRPRWLEKATIRPSGPTDTLCQNPIGTCNAEGSVRHAPALSSVRILLPPRLVRNKILPVRGQHRSIAARYSGTSSIRFPVPMSHTSNRESHKLSDVRMEPSSLKPSCAGIPRCAKLRALVRVLTFHNAISTITSPYRQVFAAGMPGDARIREIIERKFDFDLAGVHMRSLVRSSEPTDGDSTRSSVKD